jgi:acyl-coenzyme A synthetase/AMP-(fatty) acid ligase
MIKYQSIAGHASARPDATALVDLSSGRRLTWAQLADLVAHAATGLSALVAARGGRLRAAFVAENRWEIPVVQGAAATIGLPLIGVDDSLPAEHVAACLGQVQPSVLVISPSRAELVGSALALLVRRNELTVAPRVVMLADAPGVSHLDADFDLPGVDTISPWAEIIQTPVDESAWTAQPFEGLGFTSGTTGAPKLVLRTKSFEARRHQDVTEFFGITADDVYLNTVPLYHASGPGWVRIFATHGATTVIAPSADPAVAAAALAGENVTATLAVPPTLAAMLDYCEDHVTGKPARLRWVVTGGRHVSPDLVARSARLLGDVLHVYYGTTETGLNTLTAPGEMGSRPDTAGLPLPGNEILIIDDENKQIPDGQVGRVAIASYMLADTYATASAPIVDVDGRPAWVTADSGYLDADGRLYVTARDIPAAVRHVNVIALEAALKKALPIADAVALADTQDGWPRVTIAYTTDPALIAPLPDEVLAEAVRHTAQVDTQVRHIPAIPYSPTGKVRLPALRALLEQPVELQEAPIA